MSEPALAIRHKPVSLHDKQDAVTASDNAAAMLKPTLDAIAAGERLAKVTKALAVASELVENMAAEALRKTKPISNEDVAIVFRTFNRDIIIPIIEYAEADDA